MIMQKGVANCEFVFGGPLDGQRRAIANNVAVFRIQRKIPSFIGIGLDSDAAMEDVHLYVRSSDDPGFFVYQGLDDGSYQV